MGVRIRKLRAGDISAVSTIQRRITGSRRVGALAGYLRHMLRTRDGLCLVAVVDGETVGFLLGDVRPWEFGVDREVAWIKVVGVDPRRQGEGIGRLLGERFLAELRKRKIRHVKTLADWHAGDVVAYFRSLGFDRTGSIVLEKRV